MLDTLAAIDFLGASANLIEHVDLILNLFKAGFCRQPIQQFPNFIYSGIHTQLILPCKRHSACAVI